MKKKALITGITGQDGSYLAEFLIKKKYEVHGVIRKSSIFNTERIEHIYQGPNIRKKKLFLHYGDLSESSSLLSIIEKVMPDEIYNLGAQSHVAVSFQIPEYTANINGLGVLRILEIIRKSKKKIKFYQASTSELFGDTSSTNFQNEKTPLLPKSPYATSKLFAYWTVKNYRDSYNIFASNGILFNHESPRRGQTFVTKKITQGISNIYFGLDKILLLGNLDSIRDWGHAKDYAEMQWRILQHNKADDFVISTNKKCSVRNFVNKVCKKVGFEIGWKGEGLKEKGYVKKINKKYSDCKLKVNQTIIKIDKRYLRPNDVTFLRGNSLKAKKILKWKPKISLDELIKEMVDYDFLKSRSKFYLKNLNEKK